MKQLPSMLATVFLISTALFASFPLLAQNIIKAISDADKAIQQIESDEARKYASGELTRIRTSDKSPEQKIKEIQNLIQLVTEAQESSAPVSNLPILDDPAPSGNLASLIFRPPLQWSIQSIEIAYDLDSVTNVLLSAESLYREEYSKSIDDSVGGSTNGSINAGAKTRGELDVSGSVGKPEKGAWNPLNWFEAKAGFSWVTSGYAGIDYTNTKNKQWNERAQRALSNQYEEKTSTIRNDRISGRHLAFYILFKNNTNQDLKFNPQNFEIPVYAGENQPVATAKADTGVQEFRIPRNGYANLKFRAELNTTSAVNLIGYMRFNEPQIRLDRAQSVISSSDGSIQDAIQESIQVPTVPFRCRNLELQIRKDNQGKATTIADAMRAANAIFEKAPFQFDSNGNCISLMDIPLEKQGGEKVNPKRLPVIGFNGSIVSAQIPLSTLNRPLLEDGLSLDVVDIVSDDEIEEVWENTSSQKQKHYVSYLKPVAEKGDGQAQNILACCYYFGRGINKDYVEAFKWFQQSATHGVVDSIYMVGVCYESGKGVNPNQVEAMKWLLRAAEQGQDNAQFALGTHYYDGRGVKEDKAEAVKWFRKSAEQENIYAQWILGLCYEMGYGVIKNTEEAEKWYKCAADQGYALSQRSLGRLFYLNESYGKAIPWLRKAAEQGDAEAQNYLGLCYHNGYGVSKNAEDAAKWYRKAAEQGLSVAQYNLGYLFYVNKNYFEAIPWLRKAAEQGDAEAQNYLGVCYSNGYGVSKNMEEAAKWYRKAAEQGLSTAQCSLGFCYFLGDGVRQDYTEAVNWYRKAAEQGLSTAQCSLGNCYYLGDGVRQDYTEAVKWYRKAAEQNNANAFASLGDAYLDGKGVVQDKREAEKWLLKAAEQNVDCFFSLGQLYFLEKNYNEAMKWFRKAADNGDVSAQQCLGLCYKDGYNNYDEAMKWFRKAADQGDMYGQFWLGYCNEYYIKNTTEAIKWYRMSANQGYEHAKEALKRLGY